MSDSVHWVGLKMLTPINHSQAVAKFLNVSVRQQQDLKMPGKNNTDICDNWPYQCFETRVEQFHHLYFDFLTLIWPLMAVSKSNNLLYATGS